MRKIILGLFVCLLCLGSNAQKKDKYQKMADKYVLDSADRVFPQTNGVIIYTDIIDVDSSIKKDELFNRAKAWFVTEYKSANDVLQMQDKDAGIIMGKGMFKAGYNMGLMSGLSIVNVYHTVKIYVKDGKYKYEITDLNGQSYDSPSRYASGGFSDMPIGNVTIPINKKNYRKFLESIDQSIKGIISSLKIAMSKPISGSNW
jgi:hypothetical protein